MRYPPLSPLNDFVFKKLLGDPNETGPLENFLQAVIDLPKEEFAGLVILNPELTKDFNDEKTGVLDVKILTTSGKVIDVEVQVEFQEWLPERILFYSARMVSEQIGRGEDYEKIKRVICIVIADHRLVDHAAAYHHCFSLYDPKAGVPFPHRLLEIHTLEIPKVPVASDTSPLWSWMQFFAARSEGEFEMTVKDNPALGGLYGKLKELSADDKVRQLAEAREKARRDEASRNAYRNRVAYEQGIEQGVGQERKRKALETAREAIALGLPGDQIAKLSGLSLEEVLAMKEKV